MGGTEQLWNILTYGGGASLWLEGAVVAEGIF